MKYLIYLILFTLAFSTSAQNLYNETKLPTRDFVRIYNAKGKKINKGLIISFNDSTLVLRKDYKLQFIPLKDINTLRTKRSFGHSVLIVGGIGSLFFATVLYSGAEEGDIIEPEVAGSIGLAGGGICGSLIGSVAHLFKEIKEYHIGNNTDNLEAFKQHYSTYYNREFTSVEK